MSVEHHDLHHEFPDLKDQIHQLKVTNLQFRKLFDEYHELTTEIEKMEDEVTPASTDTEHSAKIKRAHLKDQLYKMIKNV